MKKLHDRPPQWCELNRKSQIRTGLPEATGLGERILAAFPGRDAVRICDSSD